MLTYLGLGIGAVLAAYAIGVAIYWPRLQDDPYGWRVNASWAEECLHHDRALALLWPIGAAAGIAFRVAVRLAGRRTRNG